MRCNVYECPLMGRCDQELTPSDCACYRLNQPKNLSRLYSKDVKAERRARELDERLPIARRAGYLPAFLVEARRRKTEVFG